MDSESEKYSESEKPLGASQPNLSASLGTRFGFSVQPQNDLFQATSIERFLMGNLRSNSNTMPPLATSNVSTLAPGEEFIHGPASALSNSFRSTHDYIPFLFSDPEEPLGGEKLSLQLSAERERMSKGLPPQTSNYAAVKTPAVVVSEKAAVTPETSETPTTARALTVGEVKTNKKEYLQEPSLRKQTQQPQKQHQPVRGDPSGDTKESKNTAAHLATDKSSSASSRGVITFLMKTFPQAETKSATDDFGVCTHSSHVVRSPLQRKQKHESSAFSVPPQPFQGFKRSYSTSDVTIQSRSAKSNCGSPKETFSSSARPSGRPTSDHRPAAGGAGRGANSDKWSTWDRLWREQQNAKDRRNGPSLPPDQFRQSWRRAGVQRLKSSDLHMLGGGTANDHGNVHANAQSGAHSTCSGGQSARIASEGSVFADASPTIRPMSVASNEAGSESILGRHMRVRAKSTNRAISEKTNFMLGPPAVGGSAASRAASPLSPCGADRRNIGPSSFPSGQPSNPSGSPLIKGYDDDILMSIFGTKRKENPHLKLFANEVAKPSIRAAECVSPCSSSTPNIGPKGSLGNSGGGSGGRGNGKGGGKKGLETADNDGDDPNRKSNKTALHTIPWDQRSFIPVTGFGTKTFGIFSAPLFWEKLDWTVRASLFTVLPVTILALEPATEHIFPFPSSAVFLAFWITMPTFGSGLREFIITLKGYLLSLSILTIVIAIPPKTDWLLLLLLFLLILCISFFAEEVKKTSAYCITVFLLELQANPSATNFQFVGDYCVNLLIALAFGLAAFFIPNIRWSSDISKTYVSLLGNSLSICVQGTCSSFWTFSPLDRELNLVRLRQLRSTAMRASSKAFKHFDEAGYEPHTGGYMAIISKRQKFLNDIFDILSSMIQVIELINDDPSRVETPLCISFGAAIQEDLAIIASAMDNMILKISDFEHLVEEGDIAFFCDARQRFQDRLAEVRQEVILNNEMYETEESDVLLGFFMFSVDELCETISNFSEEERPASTLKTWASAPLRDVKSSYRAVRFLTLFFIKHRSITRRLKEAIKLALCITVPTIFQIYALDSSETSPVAGAAIIAFVYNQTGAQSFIYGVNRVLGTVLGSLLALLAVQISSGERWALYIAVAVLSFIGAYIQTSNCYFAAGNAVCNSVISVITQYQNEDAALVRIQQNVFAILIYFCISNILWPMRASAKVCDNFDLSLRCFRESVCCLLRNLDMPEDVSEVNTSISDVLAQWKEKIEIQSTFLSSAATEPTLVGADFPETAWQKLIEAQRNLWFIISMMRHAYFTFMSSKADGETELSVHWVVLRRISPFARDLCDLIFATVDLYLLTLGKTTVVPTGHMTRLRHDMHEVEQKVVETYIHTISRKLEGEASDNGDDDSARMATSFSGFPSFSAADGVGGKAGANRNPSLPNCSIMRLSARSSNNGAPGPSHTTKNIKETAHAVSNADLAKKKKKSGYLMYNLTDEEEEELKQLLLRKTDLGRRKSFSGQTEEDKDTDDETPKKFEGTARFKLGMKTSSTHPDSADDNANDNGPPAPPDAKPSPKPHRPMRIGSVVSHFISRLRHPEGPAADDDAKRDRDDPPPPPSDGEPDGSGAAPKGPADREMTEMTEMTEAEAAEVRAGSEPETVRREPETFRLAIPDPDAIAAGPPGKESIGGAKGPQRKYSSSIASSYDERRCWSADGDRTSAEPPDRAEQLLAQMEFFDAEKKEFVLTNQDIHSLEAFLFGVRALTVQLGELQKSLLEMQHAEELERKV